MPYWENVTRSFRIAWDYKYLWLIALFAGESGAPSFSYNQGSTPSSGNSSTAQPDFGAVQEQVTSWLSDHIALIVAVAVLWVVLLIAFFILGAVCEGATVRAAAEHDAQRPFGLRWAWRSGVATMWVIVRFRLLLLLIGLPLFLFYVAFAAAVVIAIVNRNGSAVAPLVGVGGLLFLVSLPFALYVFFLDKLGSRGVILEQVGARAGIVRAHRLLFKRLGRSLLVWLLGLAVGLGLGIALACLLAFILVPLLLIGVAIAYANSAAIIPLIVVGVLVTLPISLAIQGFVAAQTATYWTLAFRRLDIDYPPPAVAPQYAAIPPPPQQP